MAKIITQRKLNSIQYEKYRLSTSTEALELREKGRIGSFPGAMRQGR
jgi:hypothetical protein